METVFRRILALAFLTAAILQQATLVEAKDFATQKGFTAKHSSERRERPRSDANCPAVGKKSVLAAKGPFEKRTALVIGNEHYCNVHGADNATSDAKLIAAALQDAGFDVILLTDADLRASIAILHEFAEESTHSAAALLYFAGLGNQVDGENYMHPTDVAMSDPDSLKRSSLSLSEVISSLERGAPTRVVILNTSRDDPFVASRAAAISRRAASPKSGMFVGFSVAPGERAVNDSGATSHFASALAESIASDPGTDIDAVFRKVLARVVRETNGMQIPWTNSSLQKPFYFIPAGRRPGGSR